MGAAFAARKTEEGEAPAKMGPWVYGLARLRVRMGGWWGGGGCIGQDAGERCCVVSGWVLEDGGGRWVGGRWYKGCLGGIVCLLSLLRQA